MEALYRNIPNLLHQFLSTAPLSTQGVEALHNYSGRISSLDRQPYALRHPDSPTINDRTLTIIRSSCILSSRVRGGVLLETSFLRSFTGA
jgi:hypothetical protein